MFDHKLITFLTVAKVGSYTKAAEELYISQPAVSQQLKNLEEELNVKLFTYKKRKLHLTQSGKQLLLFVIKHNLTFFIEINDTYNLILYD